MDARAVYDRVMKKSSSLKINDDEWIRLDKEVEEWLKTNPPEDERKLFVPFGAAEVIGMMADGVHYKRKTGRYSERE